MPAATAAGAHPLLDGGARIAHSAADADAGRSFSGGIPALEGGHTDPVFAGELPPTEVLRANVALGDDGADRVGDSLDGAIRGAVQKCSKLRVCMGVLKHPAIMISYPLAFTAP